jgi:hypothetical protein
MLGGNSVQELPMRASLRGSCRLLPTLSFREPYALYAIYRDAFGDEEVSRIRFLMDR